MWLRIETTPELRPLWPWRQVVLIPGFHCNTKVPWVLILVSQFGELHCVVWRSDLDLGGLPPGTWPPLMGYQVKLSSQPSATTPSILPFNRPPDNPFSFWGTEVPICQFDVQTWMLGGYPWYLTPLMGYQVKLASQPSATIPSTLLIIWYIPEMPCPGAY